MLHLDRSFSMLLEDFIQGMQGDREGGGGRRGLMGWLGGPRSSYVQL